jgi:hypothetical protein
MPPLYRVEANREYIRGTASALVQKQAHEKRHRVVQLDAVFWKRAEKLIRPYGSGWTPRLSWVAQRVADQSHMSDASAHSTFQEVPAMTESIWVGLDVHQDSITAAVLRGGSMQPEVVRLSGDLMKASTGGSPFQVCGTSSRSNPRG